MSENGKKADLEQENLLLPNQCLWMEETGRCTERLPVGVHYCSPHKIKMKKANACASKGRRRGVGSFRTNRHLR